MVGRRLARGIGAVGPIGMVFGEWRVLGPKRAIDLIGRDVEETERRLFVGRQPLPIGPRRLEQAERPHHIGIDEGGRAGDRAVDMAFGGKVHHGADVVGGEQFPDQSLVLDAADHQAMAGIAGQRGEVLPVAGIGQLIEIDHRLIARRQPIEHEVRADKPRPARHQNGHAEPTANGLALKNTAAI